MGDTTTWAEQVMANVPICCMRVKTENGRFFDIEPVRGTADLVTLHEVVPDRHGRGIEFVEHPKPGSAGSFTAMGAIAYLRRIGAIERAPARDDSGDYGGVLGADNQIHSDADPGL